MEMIKDSMKRLTLRIQPLKLPGKPWSTADKNYPNKDCYTLSGIEGVNSTSVLAATVLESQPVEKKVKVLKGLSEDGPEWEDMG